MLLTLLDVRPKHADSQLDVLGVGFQPWALKGRSQASRNSKMPVCTSEETAACLHLSGKNVDSRSRAYGLPSRIVLRRSSDRYGRRGVRPRQVRHKPQELELHVAQQFEIVALASH